MTLPPDEPDADDSTGTIRFLDVRATALVLAFIGVMWLITGLEESEIPERIKTAQHCIHILLWQALAFYVGGFIGEWLPRVALVCFSLVIAVGVGRLVAVAGPMLYGPDLVLLFNGVMAWLVWKAAGRFRNLKPPS